ncbi:serum paraoxonase/arylesterase 1-like [Ruditapes philippinarum]|uniref:serum paraoxonase/arylesterase 1-like n=1 Tax=Ruditapes philippinarum TaxID=129788 RepID=UPI00295B8FFF|nr:serum paraoxonase/arylesterase 1-like [Ruditapes philippinarum]
MRSSVFAIVFLGTLAMYIIQYRDWIDWNKKFIYKVAPGPCKQVLSEGGSEDVTYIGNDVVIMSSGLGAGEGEGVIKALDLNTSQVVTMEIRGAPDRKDFMTKPNGISIWKNDNGKIFVYVVTHPVSEDRVEVFKLKKNNVLKYKRTITDPLFGNMNDLVAVGRDQFYITKCLHYRDKPRSTFEYMSQSAWGSVLYFDGTKARPVVPSGLFMPNGINISPDKKMIYVSEFGNKKLLGYHRSEDNLLTKAWSYDVYTMVDNIEVDQDTGDLWVGCHPIAFRALDWMLNAFGLTLPSQVLRLKMEDNMVSSIEEIYADDGSELYGSTAATYIKGKLVIGTVTAETVLCEVNYLSPSHSSNNQTLIN